MADEDTRRLIPISIKKLEDNLWNIKIDAGESYNVEGDFDSIKKALRRIKAKDGEEYGKCRSSKKGTYASMIGDIDNNDLHKINVWKSKVPHSPDDFKKLMESKEMKKIPNSIYNAISPYSDADDCVELAKLAGIELEIKNNVMTFIGSKFNQQYIFDNGTDALYLNKNGDLILLHQLDVDGKGLEYNMNDELGIKSTYKESKEMKTITLTKNYIVEGAILPKGTIITLKEKLDFLPTDIWEKAKTIEDKHERFEFVKAELNKLGDDYTDDEIENFLSKYETELRESLTEKEVEGLGDMLDMLEETMESEDYVAKDKIDEILDIASGDEKLLKAWEAMSTADDKTFNKKENVFWSRFDEICKPFKK